jgi:hypothetical protein
VSRAAEASSYCASVGAPLQQRVIDRHKVGALPCAKLVRDHSTDPIAPTGVARRSRNVERIRKRPCRRYVPRQDPRAAPRIRPTVTPTGRRGTSNVASERSSHEMHGRAGIHQRDLRVVRCHRKDTHTRDRDPLNSGTVDHHASVASDVLADSLGERSNVRLVDPRPGREYRNDHVASLSFEEEAREGASARFAPTPIVRGFPRQLHSTPSGSLSP